MNNYSAHRFTDKPEVQLTNGKHQVEQVAEKGVIAPALHQISALLSKATAKDIQEVDDYIRQHPGKSVLYAVLGGILLSKLIRR